MKLVACLAGAGLAAALIAPALITSTPAPTGGFTLTGVIPNDVFICAAERHNPKREFLYRYWGEVFDALVESGVGGDVIELFGSVLGLDKEQAGEVDRLKQRASQLFAGIDWEQLGGKETVFAERFVPPEPISKERPPILMPDMVLLFRGSAEGAARNYEGLVAILEAMVEEINKATGTKALVVDKATRMGTEVASVNMLAMLPGAPPLPLSAALRGDVVLIALREQLLADVLGLMDGSGMKKALADDPRFKAAFAQLPPAEDSMTFFDMQALLKPLQAFLGDIVDVVSGPRDVTRNSGMSAEAGRLSARALDAYRQGDIEQALALTRQAYEASRESSIILYNLACFTALAGNKDQALAWLESAVEGGFYAPSKISSDPDLESLRGEPRYEAALAKAAELAAQCWAKDIIINSTRSGEAYRLTMQAWQAYRDKDYEQGLKLVEQAYAVAPQDSRVLYGLACFHALLGHEDQALHFLDEAVEGGFYCPQHISKDPDLESIRSHERYKAATAKAGKMAGELAVRKGGAEAQLVKHLLDRLADAVGVLDYSATVETTDGYAVRAESVAVLVPDAKSRPIYPVFGQRQQLTDFNRYLPQETASFSVSGGFDLGELYKFLEDSFRGGGPLGEELLAKWAELQKQLGVDLQADVVDWIGSDSISVTLADGGGSVWLIKVTNEQTAREKVAAALEFCSTRLPQLAAKHPVLAGLAMFGLRTSPAEHPQLEGFHDVYVTMSPQPAVWGVTDGYLIFGTSADAVALCLATARGDHPNIRNNARAMGEAIVPAGPFVSVSLTDRRGLGEELAGGLGIASMISGMLGSFVPEPELRPVLAKIAGILGKLTPVVRKIDFYKSTATQTTFDGQTWHTRAVTHFFSPAERPVKDTD